MATGAVRHIRFGVFMAAHACMRARACNLFSCGLVLSDNHVCMWAHSFLGATNHMQSAAGGCMLRAFPRCQVWSSAQTGSMGAPSSLLRTSQCSSTAQIGHVYLHFTLCSAQIDFLGEPTTGNLHLVQREGARGVSGVHALGLRHTGDVFDAPLEQLRANQQVRGDPPLSQTCNPCIACVQAHTGAQAGVPSMCRPWQHWRARTMRAVPVNPYGIYMTRSAASHRWCDARQAMLRSMGLQAAAGQAAAQRAIYCSRTLNLRSIQAWTPPCHWQDH